MAERWKDIPGYEGYYQASDHGRVRSVFRVIQYVDGRQKPVSGRVLRPSKAGRRRDYAMVQLSKANQPQARYVHDLVLLAFVGPKPAGMEARHGRLGQQDNRLRNLCYGTPSSNQQDRRRDGTGNNKPVRRSDGKEYDSIGEAAKDVGLVQSCLSRVLHKHQTEAAGFTWEFLCD